MLRFELKLLRKPYGGIARGSNGAAGYDLCAAIDEPVVLGPGETRLIPSGVAIHIKDPDYVGFVLPRSGLGAKQGLIMANGTGVIDSDYQGEIFIPTWNRNFSEASHGIMTIEPGARIAQLVFLPVLHPEFDIVKEFTKATDRGAGGFGSSGTK